jgi:hypothetical protein
MAMIHYDSGFPKKFGFSPGKVIYFTTTQWSDVEFGTLTGRKNFHEILDKRINSLEIVHRMPKDVSQAMRESLTARYEMLSRCLLPDFNSYCGLGEETGPSNLAGMPPNSRTKHVLYQ